MDNSQSDLPLEPISTNVSILKTENKTDEISYAGFLIRYTAFLIRRIPKALLRGTPFSHSDQFHDSEGVEESSSVVEDPSTTLGMTVRIPRSSAAGYFIKLRQQLFFR